MKKESTMLPQAKDALKFYDYSNEAATRATSVTMPTARELHT
jgi:hypothetical protein